MLAAFGLKIAPRNLDPIRSSVTRVVTLVFFNFISIIVFIGSVYLATSDTLLIGHLLQGCIHELFLCLGRVI